MTAVVHLLAGLTGAGKTTLARRLEADLPAVRFTLDEWMLRLHGLAFDDPRYPPLAQKCRDLIWDVAAQTLRTGTSVVLDWNLWSRALRSEAVERAGALGFGCHLHHVAVPLDVAIRRAATRTAQTAHVVSSDDVRHLATIFEPPDASETGFVVTRLGGSA